MSDNTGLPKGLPKRIFAYYAAELFTGQIPALLSSLS